MQRRLRCALVLACLAGAWATSAPAQERYCNGRPRVLRGVKLYPSGRPIQIGDLVLFPNGNPTAEEDGSLLYPSGAPFYKTKVKGKERPRFLYPNGNTLLDGTTSFYPNGKVLFQNGLFYDQKARIMPEGPRQITMQWRDHHYTFDVVDGIPSQKVITVKMRELDVVTSFRLQNGMITEVDANCAPPETPGPTS